MTVNEIRQGRSKTYAAGASNCKKNLVLSIKRTPTFNLLNQTREVMILMEEREE
jgi:hypothetical protein